MPFLNKNDWTANIQSDLLSGLVVALALIPEAIAFSIIVGVDPKVGLYASGVIAIVISFFGGRQAMISAATGAMALIMVTLYKEYGVEYIFAAAILTGILQIIAGYLKLGSLMSFVSQSVITGFVNALAVLIFMAQLPEITGSNAVLPVYAMTILGLGVIYLFPLIPKLGKIIPSPLVCIIGLTLLCHYLGLEINRVGDMGELPNTMPSFWIPNVPYSLETLKIILPYSLGLTVVGLLESLMTATIVDDLTDTPSSQNQECKGQGLANIASGFFGGMAGCGMIGQSIINVKSGGRGRLSSLSAGVFLLLMVVFLGSYLALIPMAALVAVMIMVSIGTFSWSSLGKLRKHPLSSNIVMISTVIVVIYTHNLAYGVFVGVLLAVLFFAHKISHFMTVEKIKTSKDNFDLLTFNVKGQVFFNSAARFINYFDFKEVASNVIINLEQAHFWDISAVAALDKAVVKFRRAGSKVEVIGLNKASKTIVDRFGVFDNPEEIKKLLSGH